MWNQLPVPVSRLMDNMDVRPRSVGYAKPCWRGSNGYATEARPQVPNIGALWRTETTSRWEGRK